MIRNMGKSTIFMIAAVAAGIFGLPTVLSVDTGQHILLIIVLVLIIITSILIFTIKP